MAKFKDSVAEMKTAIGHERRAAVEVAALRLQLSELKVRHRKHLETAAKHEALMLRDEPRAQREQPRLGLAPRGAAGKARGPQCGKVPAAAPSSREAAAAGCQEGTHLSPAPAPPQGS